MTEQTMVEKVAIAIHATAYETRDQARMPDWDACARAAIEAMREPDEAMVGAGYKVLCRTDEPPNPEEHWEGWITPQIFSAMIDAALSPTEGG